MHLHESIRELDVLQKISMSLMGVLVIITFVGANLHALLWQSSEYLVSTVLPAVVVDLTNDERDDSSRNPLVRNSILDNAATLKAQHMAENEYFSHYSPDGVSPWYWFDEAGYVYAHAGENLAIHFTDSSEVVDAWMDSPTHRQNIVNGLYTEIGVGTAKGEFDGHKTVYVVQLFGTPAIAPAPIEVAAVIPEAAPVLPQPQVAASEIVAVPDPAVVEPAPVLEVVSEAPVESIVADPAPVATEEVVTTNTESVAIETDTISVSSGLPVAETAVRSDSNAGRTAPAITTQPNTLLQILYTVLALLVVVLLGTSVIQEARRFHLQQVAYGVLMLVGMTGLWYAHITLTSGAIIV